MVGLLWDEILDFSQKIPNPDLVGATALKLDDKPRCENWPPAAQWPAGLRVRFRLREGVGWLSLTNLPLAGCARAVLGGLLLFLLLPRRLKHANFAPPIDSQVPTLPGVVDCHCSSWLRFAADTNSPGASPKPHAHHRIGCCNRAHAAQPLQCA